MSNFNNIVKKDKSCWNCKYLEKDPLPDTWFRQGDYFLYCDNENATFKESEKKLDEDLLEDYPKTCQGFEAIAEAGVK